MKNTYISKSVYNTHTFEIVEKVDSSYFVWNIGDNMGSDTLIPMSQDLYPNDPEDYHINQFTLKAIELPTEEVKKLRYAAGYGVVSLETCQKVIKSKRRSRRNAMLKPLCEELLPVFEKLYA